MLKDKLYLATIAPDAALLAKKHGLGIEIDEFCTAFNMDVENFSIFDKKVREKMCFSNKYIIHAPFNELFPAAIDPLALNLAYQRYEQTYKLAREYGINRMVVHSGYVPFIYFKSWFLERSCEFWQKFISDKPQNFQIAIENVLEDEPHTLAKLIENIGDARVKACLDVGHANFNTKLGLVEWVRVLGPYLGHVHLHNNDSIDDRHWPLGKGNMDMNAILEALQVNAPHDLTYTLENSQCEESLNWLIENGWII